jgi:hypothetical protein
MRTLLFTLFHFRKRPAALLGLSKAACGPFEPLAKDVTFACSTRRPKAWLLPAVMSFLVSLACSVAVSATVYKWVDENGVTHYSDQPHENSQKVELQAPQTYSAPRSTKRATTSASASAPPAAPYLSCALIQPAADETYMNASSVSAAVSLQPAARPGDQIFLLLDGQRVPGLPTSGSQFTIPVDRGSHSLQAVVQDSSGHVVCQSSSVSFNVHQPSIQNPVNPARPR